MMVQNRVLRSTFHKPRLHHNQQCLLSEKNQARYNGWGAQQQGVEQRYQILSFTQKKLKKQRGEKQNIGVIML